MSQMKTKQLGLTTPYSIRSKLHGREGGHSKLGWHVHALLPPSSSILWFLVVLNENRRRNKENTT